MCADKVQVANRYSRDSQSLSLIPFMELFQGAADGERRRKKDALYAHARVIGYDVLSVLSQTSSTYSILNGFARTGSIIHECGETTCRAGEGLYNVMYVFLSKEQQPNTG